MKGLTAAMALVVAAAAPAAARGQHPGHDHAAMNARGAVAMGFDQDRATHHFRLTPEGGRIEVRANEKGDTDTTRRVRDHLQAIRTQFAAGDFGAPRHTHAEDPPGVPVMKRLRARIEYRYVELEGGGRVVLSTRDPEARDALHAFLLYQIREHRTGDPEEVETP